MNNSAHVLLQTVLQVFQIANRALTGPTPHFPSMGSNESEVQLVEPPNNVTIVEPDTPSVVDVDSDKQQPSFSRFSKNRRSHQNKSICVEKNGVPCHGQREQEKHDYTVPGTQLSKLSRSNNVSLHTSILRPPLDTSEVVEIPESQKTLITGAEHSPRRLETDKLRVSPGSGSLAYNEDQLRSDRARREARKTLLFQSPTAAQDDDTTVAENENVHQSSQQGTALDEPLQTSVKNVPQRRSLRQASTMASIRRNEQREKIDRVLELESKEVAAEVKDLTSTEIGYDGPRHLIFIYPPGGRGKIRVTVEERERLRQRKYLNDSIIDFYLKYLETDLKRRPAPLNFNIKFFSSFFFGVLRRVKQDEGDGRRNLAKFADCIDYWGVKNWTKGTDLFSMDFIIVPICDSYHWSLIIVANLRDLQTVLERDMNPSRPLSDQKNPADPKIIYLDSLDPKRGHEFAKLMRHYLVEEWLVRKMQYSSEKSAELRAEFRSLFRRAFPVLKPNVPVQNNEYDCGLYLLNSLSMFLDNTDNFMEKALSGELQLREIYDSGDITKLRKNITCLMDSFEDEWKRNNTSGETRNEGESDKAENGEMAKANETEKAERQMAMEGAPIKHPIPPFSEVNKVCSEIQDGDCRSFGEKDEDVQSSFSNHVPLDEESSRESLQGPGDKLPNEVQMSNNSDVYSIATSDDADVAAMEIDGSGDDNEKSHKEGLHASTVRTREEITEIEQPNTDDLPSPPSEFDRCVKDTDVEITNTYDVDMDPKEAESNFEIRGVILSERSGDRQRSQLKRKRRHPYGLSQVQGTPRAAFQRSVSEFQDDLMRGTEETLDGGKADDINTPIRLAPRRRYGFKKAGGRDGTRRARHTPSSGFGGLDLERTEDEELQTRNVTGGVRRGTQKPRIVNFEKMENDSDEVQRVSDDSDSEDGREVTTLDLNGRREVMKRDVSPPITIFGLQTVDGSSDNDDHDYEVQITGQGNKSFRD